MVVLPNWVAQGFALLATLFILAVGLAVLTIIIMYIVDATQRKDAVRHNFPVLGRFRYIYSSFWASFFVSIFSPWTVRKCPLTVQSVNGCTAPPRIRA